jgi:hypothetical protein
MTYKCGQQPSQVLVMLTWNPSLYQATLSVGAPQGIGFFTLLFQPEVLLLRDLGVLVSAAPTVCAEIRLESETRSLDRSPRWCIAIRGISPALGRTACPCGLDGW